MYRGILNLPCLAHHQIEVSIVIDGGTHSSVIVHKFVKCHLLVPTKGLD